MKKKNQTGIKRPGSGRTTGSTSFVFVTIGELCAKIADPKTPIKVSRLQMEAMGFLQKANESAPEPKVLTPQKPQVVVQEIDFDIQQQPAV